VIPHKKGPTVPVEAKLYLLHFMDPITRYVAGDEYHAASLLDAQRLGVRLAHQRNEWLVAVEGPDGTVECFVDETPVWATYGLVHHPEAGGEERHAGCEATSVLGAITIGTELAAAGERLAEAWLGSQRLVVIPPGLDT
jgi:hypothetical protein